MLTSAAVPNVFQVDQRRAHGAKSWHYQHGWARLVVYNGGRWAVETRVLGFLWWRHRFFVADRADGYAEVDNIIRDTQ